MALAALAAQAQEAQAAACALRPPAYRLLYNIVEAGESGIGVSEAAGRLGVRPQALAGPAAELAEAGLITRLVDERDSRARRLLATPAGTARLAPALALRAEMLKHITQAIPQASVARLVLDKLMGALRQALPPGPVPAED
ncbi:MAG: MarR family winged helix-turn-helix transcriptional regulator [Thermodesulfobacteriota bacterium]